MKQAAPTVEADVMSPPTRATRRPKTALVPDDDAGGVSLLKHLGETVDNRAIVDDAAPRGARELLAGDRAESLLVDLRDQAVQLRQVRVSIEVVGGGRCIEKA